MTQRCVWLTLLSTSLALLAGQSPIAPDKNTDQNDDPAHAAEDDRPREQVSIADEQFKLELATTPAQRANGLMGRKELDVHGGMLFVYPKPQILSFWMKDCLIDLDILFLDSRGRIVCTHKMKAEPPRGEDESQASYEARLKSYSSRRPAQFAIELKAGSIERLKLEPGQMIALDVERLRKMAR